MKFKQSPLLGLYEIELEPIGDERGWFQRTFCTDEFLKIGFNQPWVQMNHSFNKFAGTVRGLHFQLAPFQETKLVRCIAGRVYDVAVDLRKDSPTLLHSYQVELSPSGRNMLLIPGGFAHGFMTLEDNTELVYCHTKPFTPEFESGIRHDDPLLKIKFPRPVSNISQRDAAFLPLSPSFKGIEL